MRRPLVSVVIPTRNRRVWLLDAISAISAQSYDGEIEICVVDDGSVDGTLEAVRGRVWTREVRMLSSGGRGPAAARNMGLRSSKGDVVVFIDDDCLPQPGWLAQLVPAAMRGGAGGRTRMLTDGSLVADFNAILWDEAIGGTPDAVPPILSCNAGFRRDVLAAGFDEGFAKPGCEDVELVERLRSARVPLVFVPDAVVVHRPRSGMVPLLRLGHNYGRGWAYYRQKQARPLRIGELVKMIVLLPFFWLTTGRYRAHGPLRAIAYALLNRLRLAAAAFGALSARGVLRSPGPSVMQEEVRA